MSRIHAEVVFKGGEWRLRDLKSANGIYVNGELTPSLSITENATVSLGNGGPKLTFSLEKPRSRTVASKRFKVNQVLDFVSRWKTQARPETSAGH